MMVKIRLQRFGAKKAPQYRIVACDSRAPRDGKFLEIIGTYNPLTNPATVNVNAEAALKWLNNGAQPTTTVKNILKSQNIAK
ncbi:MAG: 30S ribosomal protein S16 [Anaeroplasmataceae bacterium]